MDKDEQNGWDIQKYMARLTKIEQRELESDEKKKKRTEWTRQKLNTDDACEELAWAAAEQPNGDRDAKQQRATKTNDREIHEIAK